jgi:glycerophosphoryl diester phosphodiesterase
VGRTLIIGHRGFAAHFPDNSVAGVRAAFAAGADGVEVDVRPCADGVWVCHHDRSRGGRPVAEWLLTALGRAGVPTLAEVVTAVPAQRWLYVEIKPLALANLAQGMAELRGLLRHRAAFTRVLSSSPAVLALVGAELPSLARSWVIGDLPVAPPAAGIELSPRHTLVETLLDWRLPLHPWTVNDAPRMRQLLALGVASLTSNRPDLAVEVARG